MVMEKGCRKCHRDAHMVSSKSAKMGFLSSSWVCYAAFNTWVGVHRDGNAKSNPFICLVFSTSIYALSLWKHPSAVFKRLIFIG